MPIMVREKTQYPGVVYVTGTGANGRPERIYYIRYRRSGKQVEEKAGRQFQDNMTPAKASRIRADRIRGDASNQERREAERTAKEAETGRWTIDRLFKEYCASKVMNKSLKTDGNRYEKHIKPLFGEKEPHEILALDVDRIRIRMSKTHKPQTVRHVLALLSRIVSFGIRKQLCPGLGFKIEFPSVDNKKTEDLTPNELSRLLHILETDHDIQAANLMKLALFTGMRRGELFRLKWEHVDFQRGFIFIDQPKGGKSAQIPLNDAARALLENHLRISGSLYVFPGRGGEQRTEIKRVVNRIKREAGLPADFRPLHGLRHTYASMLASSGEVDMYTLQKLLTHKTPLMTQRYAHLRDETLRAASNVAGRIIEQASRAGEAAKADEA